MDEHDQDDAGPPRTPAEGVRIIGAEEAQAAIESGQASGRTAQLPTGADDEPRATPTPPAPAAPPDTNPPDLPHWTEPPSGENPRILPEGDTADEEDLGAWAAYASQGPRWRDHPADWDEADFEDPSVLGDEEVRMGALDPEAPGPSDLFTFDEPPATTSGTGVRPDPGPGPGPPEPEPVRPISTRPVDTGGPLDAGGPGSGPIHPRDLGVAVGVGVGVGAAVLIAAWIGPAALTLLVTAVLVLAAIELFGALRQRGYQPATLLGLVATASMCGAAYWRGEQAFPLVMALAVVFTMLWYLLGVVHALPATNVGATLLAFTYVGFLGAFAPLILKLPDGVGILLGAIIVTVANDVGAFFVGSRFGSTPLAPAISPNKTVEGYLGGGVASLAAALVIVLQIHPWNFGRVLDLGLLVGFVAAPLGDLCESMLKRDLGVKDMGAVLPGHGGVLDRIDAMLFVAPTTYYLMRLLKVA